MAGDQSRTGSCLSVMGHHILPSVHAQTAKRVGMLAPCLPVINRVMFHRELTRTDEGTAEKGTVSELEEKSASSPHAVVEDTADGHS